MTYKESEQQLKDDIFLKAMGTLFLFVFVIVLNGFVESWFPSQMYIQAFSIMLVFSVWGIFVYYCYRFYRVSKYVPFRKMLLIKKRDK